MRKLTLKEQRFVRHYIETGNAAEAVRRAGYQLGSKNGSKAIQDVNNTASSIGLENLQKPAIRNAVNKALVRQDITPENVLISINGIAQDLEEKTTDRLKALELLGKSLKLFGVEDSKRIPANIVIQLGDNSANSTHTALDSENTEEAEQVKNTIQASSSQ